jgi:hypothetical protein
VERGEDYGRTSEGGGEEEKKKKKGGGKAEFIPEVLGRPVAIELDGKDEPIAGMIVENSTFWIKVQDVNGRIMHLNKAYVKSIIPLK